MPSLKKPALAGVLTAGLLVGGCGSSANSPGPTAAGSSASTPASQSSSPSGGAASSGSPVAGALSADARSKATGDIPDNQIFLTFSSRSAGFSMKYPEGWTLSGSGTSRTFRDKNNLVRVIITHAPVPTPASASRELTKLRSAQPTLTFRAPQIIQLSGGPAVKVVYTTLSAPDPVTGKRVQLLVDRYEIAKGGRVATVDLGTPKGVDNVDAYRMMIQSFRWL